MDIKKLVMPNVRALRAYDPGEVRARTKLDANEAPRGFKLDLRGISPNRYPDPGAKELRRALGGASGVGMENVLMGNGSDELIYYLVTTFGGPVLYPEPTFSMYSIISRALGVRALGVPLDGQFDIDLASTLAIIKKEKPKLMFLSSPNNPTGNCFSASRVLKIIESARAIVVVDEAYQPYAGGKGFSAFLGDYPNLAVMRTLSKVGLAGLRVGYLLAGPEVIAEVNKVRLPFNLNSLSQAAALSALKDKKRMRQILALVTSERARLLKALDAMDGVSPFPTEANFVLFKVSDPGRVWAGLLKRGVLVRDVSPMVSGCLRVTVGTKKENNEFLAALKRAL